MQCTLLKLFSGGNTDTVPTDKARVSSIQTKMDCLRSLATLDSGPSEYCKLVSLSDYFPIANGCVTVLLKVLQLIIYTSFMQE